MSSVTVWTDKSGRVSARWNKEGPYSVHVIERVDANGWSHGRTTTHANERAAIAAARRKAKALANEENQT